MPGDTGRSGMPDAAGRTTGSGLPDVRFSAQRNATGVVDENEPLIR